MGGTAAMAYGRGFMVGGSIAYVRELAGGMAGLIGVTVVRI